MVNPKISIIIPVYNVEKYLPQCLDSIINQTLKDIEIICIDDGSTDNSLNILKEYQKKDNRIIIIEQQNGGAGKARNNGLKVARGKYLLFLDADDFFERNMCEKCYKKIEEEESDVLVFYSKQYNNKTKTVTEMPWSLRIQNLPNHKPFSPNEMNKYIFNSFQNWPWNKMFRHDFIKRNNIFFQEIKRTNDMAFVCLALALSNKISIIEEAFTYYRIETGTSLQQTNDKSPLCFWEACLETKRRLQEYGIYENYEQSLLNTILTGAFYNLGTLKTWKAYNELYFLLKNDFENKLKFTEHSQDYFYNQNLFKELQKIQQKSVSEYLFEKMVFYKMLNENKKNESNKSKKTFFELLNGGIKCYREHGMKYTLNRVLVHLHLKKENVNIKNYNYYKNLSPDKYSEELKLWYKYNTGKTLNLDNPVTFNEKLQWLKLYDSTPLKTQLADKYLVRKWIKEKIGEEYLVPLLGVWDKFDDIDFTKLPNSFVLKANHGCGWNIIVKDKSKFNVQEARKKI